MTSSNYNPAKKVVKYLATAATVGIMALSGNEVYSQTTQKKDSICSSVKESKVWTEKYKERVTKPLKDSLEVMKKKCKNLESKFNSVKNDTVDNKDKVVKYNIKIDNSTNTINNFYGKQVDETKTRKKKNNFKLSDLYNRGILEVSTNVDMDSSVENLQHGEILGAYQTRLVDGRESDLSIGPFLGLSREKIKEDFSLDVYSKAPVSENMNTVTEGVRSWAEEAKSNFKFGIRTSLDAEILGDRMGIRANLDLGLKNKSTSLSSIHEEGDDMITLNENIIDSKPYSIDLPNEKGISGLVPSVGASINFMSGTEKFPFYLKVGVNQDLKSKKFKSSKPQVNVGFGWTIGRSW